MNQEKLNKIFCKKIGHNYCPDAIKVDCCPVVNIRFKCRRCGKEYRKLYPSIWHREGGIPYD